MNGGYYDHVPQHCIEELLYGMHVELWLSPKLQHLAESLSTTGKSETPCQTYCQFNCQNLGGPH